MRPYLSVLSASLFCAHAAAQSPDKPLTELPYSPGLDTTSMDRKADPCSDFYQYALTSLDRNYVPLSVKDFVRDYFSSLDPTQ